jgi:hypothetical protein
MPDPASRHLLVEGAVRRYRRSTCVRGSDATSTPWKIHAALGTAASRNRPAHQQTRNGDDMLKQMADMPPGTVGF